MEECGPCPIFATGDFRYKTQRTEWLGLSYWPTARQNLIGKRADKDDSLLHYLHKVDNTKPRIMMREHGYKIAGKLVEVD